MKKKKKKRMNNKGELFTDVLMAMIILLFMTISISVISKGFGVAKGKSGLNCVGYIDPDATSANNESHLSTRNTDTIACSVLNFGVAFWVISILFIVIAKLMSGQVTQPTQVSPYAGY